MQYFLTKPKFVSCAISRHERANLKEIVLCDNITNSLVVLDTCLRFETFGSFPQNVKIERIYTNLDAFVHLCKIAAGIESRIVGEKEILGQVRNAYNWFKRTHPYESDIDKIFREAFKIAREVRRKTGLDKDVISVGSLAGRRIKSFLKHNEPIAIIGAGQVASQVATFLYKHNVSNDIRIASRSYKHTETLSGTVKASSFEFTDLQAMFAGVSVIVTATTSEKPIIKVNDLVYANRPLFIIDLSDRGDCTEKVKIQEKVSYLSLKELENQAESNTVDRQRKSLIAEQLIRISALKFMAKLL